MIFALSAPARAVVYTLKNSWISNVSTITGEQIWRTLGEDEPWKQINGILSDAVNTPGAVVSLINTINTTLLELTAKISNITLPFEDRVNAEENKVSLELLRAELAKQPQTVCPPQGVGDGYGCATKGEKKCPTFGYSAECVQSVDGCLTWKYSACGTGNSCSQKDGSQCVSTSLFCTSDGEIGRPSCKKCDPGSAQWLTDSSLIGQQEKCSGSQQCNKDGICATGCPADGAQEGLGCSSQAVGFVLAPDVGGTACNSSTGKVIACQQQGSCKVWSQSSNSCASGLVCSGGHCTTACPAPGNNFADGCPVIGYYNQGRCATAWTGTTGRMKCVGTTINGVECKVWGVEACAGGQACNNGTCAPLESSTGAAGVGCPVSLLGRFAPTCPTSTQSLKCLQQGSSRIWTPVACGVGQRCVANIGCF